MPSDPGRPRSPSSPGSEGGPAIGQRLAAGHEWMTILDALEEAILLEREDGTVARCNKAAAQMFGFELRSVAGRPLLEVLGAEVSHDSLREPAALLFNAPGARILELTTHSLEGPGAAARWVHIFRDVTERRRLESIARSAGIIGSTRPHAIEPLEQVIDQHIRAAFAAHARHQQNTAAALGISLSTLRRKLITLGLLSRPGERGGVNEADE